MFYMKKKRKKLPIEDPIYTICPMCGCEHEIDITDVLTTGGDLYSTAVYCERCTRDRLRERMGAHYQKEVQINE